METKIYKIASTKGSKIYIGSTAKFDLDQRLQQHINAYNRFKNGKGNKTTSFILFDEYGIDNCKIELIELKECNNAEEKNKLEGGYIQSLECVNKIVVGRSRAETQRAYNQSEAGKAKLKKHHETDKYKERIRLYNASDKAKEVIKTYKQTDHYKNRIKIYNASDKAKNIIKLYQQSDIGKQAQKRASFNYYQKKKALKLVNLLL